MIGGFVGAKLYYLAEVAGNGLTLHDLGPSGFTWYGGLIGGSVAVFVVSRRAPSSRASPSQPDEIDTVLHDFHVYHPADSSRLTALLPVLRTTLHWFAVVAISAALVLGFLLLLESRDDSSIGQAAIPDPASESQLQQASAR